VCALLTILTRPPEFGPCEWHQCRQIFLEQMIWAWTKCVWRLSEWWRNHGGIPTWLFGCGIPRLGILHSEFLTPSLPLAETRVDLNVKCLLLFSDFNQNWCVSTSFSETLENQMKWKSVQRFSSCYIRAGGKIDGRTDRQRAKLICRFLQPLVVKGMSKPGNFGSEQNFGKLLFIFKCFAKFWFVIYHHVKAKKKCNPY
jgi:hypothetical protein